MFRNITLPLFLLCVFGVAHLASGQTYSTGYTGPTNVTGGHFGWSSTSGVAALAANREDTLGGYDILLSLFRDDGSIIRSINLDPTGNRESVSDVWVGHDSYTYVAGAIKLGSMNSGLLARIDSLGVMSWACAMGGTSSPDEFFGLTGFTDSLGNNRVAAAGFTLQLGALATEDAYLIATSQGFPAYTLNNTYIGPGHERWTDVTYTSSNHLVTVGTVRDSIGWPADIIVGCYTTNGIRIWLRRIMAAGDDVPVTVEERNGYLAIGGYTNSASAPSYRPFVGKINLASGALEKMVTYPSAPGTDLAAHGLTITSDTSVYVFGGWNEVGGKSFFAKLNSNLVGTMSKTVSGGGSFTGGAVMPDGGLLMGGTRLGALSGSDFHLARTDAAFDIGAGCAGNLTSAWIPFSATDTILPDSSSALPVLVTWNLNPATESLLPDGPCTPLYLEAGANEISWEMFPQPASQTLTVRFNDPITNAGSIAIFTLTGSQASPPLHFQPGFTQATMDVSHLAPGIYVCRVSVGNETVHRRVIIQ